MSNLTELKDGAFYYTINGIEEAHFCEVNGVPELVMPELEEVLAPVPSYEEWQPFTDTYFNGLTTKEISELAKKSIRLTTQHCKDNEEIEILREQLDVKNGMVDSLIIENTKLKELLKECKHIIEWYKADYKGADVLNEDVITKIDKALK